MLVLSKELDDVGKACLKGEVPSVWMAVSYPSLKPLEAYINDLLKRLHLFDEWTAKGPPVAFWFSGFFLRG